MKFAKSHSDVKTETYGEKYIDDENENSLDNARHSGWCFGWTRFYNVNWG